MPAIVAWIGSMLVTVGGTVIARALVALGLGFATTAAFQAAGIGDRIRAVLGSAGPMYDWVGFFGIDTSLTIFLSALAARAAVNAGRTFLVARGGK